MAEGLASVTSMPAVPGVQDMYGSFPSAPSGYVGPKEMAPALGQIESQRQQATQGEMQASQKIGELESQKRQEELQGKINLAEQTKKDIVESPEKQRLDEARQKLSTMAFAPHKDTAQDLAGMFGLISVIGMVVGKGNAQGALGAMNGMMQGYQQGREDLYKHQKDEFDRNFKAMQSKVEMLSREFDEALKLRNYDKEAGELKLQQTLAKFDSPLLQAQAQKQGYVKVKETLDGIKKDVERAADMQNKLQSAADKRADAAQRAREMHEYRMAMLQLKTQAAGSRNTAINDRYAFNITEAFGQAATDLLNISYAPKGSTLGTFAGMTGKSGDTLASSLSNAFARKVTPEDQRAMQQIVAGLDQNMGRALGGGYASSSAKHALEAYKEQVMRAGDTPAAQALFLARMKQELGVLAATFEHHPGSNPQYVAQMGNLMKQLNERIPFNVRDVLSAINKTGGKTVTDSMKRYANEPIHLAVPQDSGAPMSITVPVNAVGDTQSSPAAQKEQAQEGERIYQDANGNKAVYRDGKWVEVQ